MFDYFECLTSQQTVSSSSEDDNHCIPDCHPDDCSPSDMTWCHPDDQAECSPECTPADS